MRKVGDYEWQQLSMWDMSPANCIQKFIPIDGTKECAHYILNRIIKVSDDGSGWTVEKVLSVDGVPLSVLEWRNTGYYNTVDHKSEFIEKETLK